MTGHPCQFPNIAMDRGVMDFLDEQERLTLESIRIAQMVERAIVKAERDGITRIDQERDEHSVTLAHESTIAKYRDGESCPCPEGFR